MSNQLELRHLRYFLTLAEELHFRKAAEKLFISQPGLSRQIKQLEDDLGITLFERHNRKVVLSPTGVYLKKEIGILLKNLDTVITHSQLIEKGFEGELKFGYIGSAMQNVIPDLLLTIRKEIPNIHFNLKEMDNQQQVDSVLNHDIDFGFVRLERVPKGIEIQPLLQDTFSLVLPNNHPISETNFKDLSQLKTESFILFDASYSEPYYQNVMQLFDDSGFTPIVSHNTIHASSIYRLVENNFGVSIVPTSLKMGYQMDIKFIELKNIRQRTTLQLIWNKSNRNPIIKKVLNLFK